MFDKNNIPKFFHRLRKENQKTIRVGFLFSDFNDLSSIILPYFEVKNEKISKAVFFINNAEIISSEVQSKVDEWIDFTDEDSLKVAQSIYDKKIDTLIVLSDSKFIEEVLNYQAAPVQIAGANALSLRDKIKNKRPYVDAIFGDNFIRAIEKIDTIELNSALCYLPNDENKIIENINKNINKIIFGALYNEKDKENDKRIAKILERVASAKIKFFSDTFKNEKDKINAKKRLVKSKIPEEKIELVSLDNLSQIDIFLDTCSKNEITLILNLLYNGIPVISMTDIGRSILNAVSLSELGVNTKEDYINIASLIASDNELISGLNSNLKNIMKSSQLMNTEAFAKNIEAAVFASFDYILSLKDDIPSKQEFKILWDIVNESGRPINENEFAIMERILLTRPTKPEDLNYLAVLLSYYDEEKMNSILEYFPENTLAKNYLTLQLAYKEKTWDIAERSAAKILNLEPKTNQEHYMLSQSLYRVGCVYEKMGRLNDSIDKFLECVEKTSDSNLEIKCQVYSNYLFLLHYTDMQPKEIFEQSKRYASFFKNFERYPHVKKAKEKIRIGYISSDFRKHVVANFAFVFFIAKNKERFETYAYMLNDEDHYTNLFKKSADCYRNLKDIDCAKSAQIIYNDNIDILVDLSGHVGSGLPILAKKPAPIQICGIGYFSTTGLPEVDYFLVDKYMAPESEDELFTEKLLRLPNSHFCYTNIIPPTERTNSFEKNNFITFGSMNSANKMNDKVWSAWAEILKRVPNSKLFLKNIFYADSERLNREKEQMKKYNIAPERVTFEVASGDYLKKYNDIDIALDTFPYPGGGTTCDALLMSVPVITLSGNSCHERFGKSILCNIGLEELVANSIEEYIEIAVNLANDRMRIKKYHNEIYNLMENSAIMNQYLYIQDLEAAYEKIYEEWLNSD